MSQLKEFVDGLLILKNYYDKPDGYHLGAEHDIIYVYSTDKPLPENLVKELIDLGFHQEEIDTDGGDFEVKHYDPEEGWAFYV